jgi:hypothetical protein
MRWNDDGQQATQFCRAFYALRLGGREKKIGHFRYVAYILFDEKRIFCASIIMHADERVETGVMSLCF